MFFRVTPYMRVIGYLTLLMCFWTTGDLVVDLVFEEPNLALNPQGTTDEPDNAAEHLLMMSQRADGSGTDTLAADFSGDLLTISTAFIFTNSAALQAAVPPKHPPPTSSRSFSVPLRI